MTGQGARVLESFRSGGRERGGLSRSQPSSVRLARKRETVRIPGRFQAGRARVRRNCGIIRVRTPAVVGGGGRQGRWWLVVYRRRTPGRCSPRRGRCIIEPGKQSGGPSGPRGGGCRAGGGSPEGSRGNGKSRERGSAVKSFPRTRDLLAPRLCDRPGVTRLRSSSILPRPLLRRARDKVVAIGRRGPPALYIHYLPARSSCSSCFFNARSAIIAIYFCRLRFVPPPWTSPRGEDPIAMKWKMLTLSSVFYCFRFAVFSTGSLRVPLIFFAGIYCDFV